MGTRNVHTKRLHDSAQVTQDTGTDADAGDGQVAVTFSNLRRVGGEGDVFVQAEGGYNAAVNSVTGSKVIVDIYAQDADDGALGPVAAATTVTVNAHAYGE